MGKRFLDGIKKSLTHPLGGPTSVGKILDKSRPPELRRRYPRPYLFPENSIAAKSRSGDIRMFYSVSYPTRNVISLENAFCTSIIPFYVNWLKENGFQLSRHLGY